MVEPAQAQADWRASGEQTLPFFTPPAPDHCLWRLSVPQTAPVLDLPYPAYIEWQGAQRWLWAPASAATALRQATQGVGGHATLFRASQGDADKSVGVFTPTSKVLLGLSRELQKQLDPAGVFQTGRMGL